MGVIVVKLGSGAARRRVPDPAPVAPPPAALPLWVVGASLTAPAIGVVIVFASMLPAAIWLRVALIVLGALVGLAGLAVLAVDACREGGRARPAS